MGFLEIRGRVMFYSEYKDHCEKYKLMGIKQFINIYKAHKARQIKRQELHWGEEIEYTLFYFD
jgi:hypothetical protein